MRSLKPLAIASVSAVSLSLVVHTQESVDLAVVNRIKTEAFQKSAVMDHLRMLTDVHGPRLTGSPQFEAAAKWAMDRLTGYGLRNVHIERWPFGRSWAIGGYSVEMLQPQYARLSAAPLACTRSTSGPLTGEPVLAPLEGGFLRGPKKSAERLDAYRRQWTGKLRGKIVLMSAPLTLPHRETPMFKRESENDLSEIAKAPEPAAARAFHLDDLEWPENEKELFKMFMAMPEAVVDELIDRFDALDAQRSKFLNDEGVAAVLLADERARDGLLAAEAAGSYHAKDPLAPPTFVLTAEHYDRLARLTDHHEPPARVRVELNATASETDVEGGNIIGEIAGEAKRDEIVMIGAHFDSWHTGTGATDNGAGSAVMIEVMRILAALRLPLARTVRLGLWGGEEQGLLGSRAYVKAHFGDPATMTLRPEHAKLSAYFNLDNGSGRIRGVYLQEHDAMRPLFEQWLAPFRDLGVSTISLRNTGGTDHLSFARVGLPGFQFIQDPLDYMTATHHTSADTYDHAVPADLMQAAAVISSLVYDVANRPEPLPRRALPAPERSGVK